MEQKGQRQKNVNTQHFWSMCPHTMSIEIFLNIPGLGMENYQRESNAGSLLQCIIHTVPESSVIGEL